MKRATDAKKVQETAQKQEEVDLALADVLADFYETSASETYPEFVKKKLEEGITTSSGSTIKLEEDGKIKYKDSNGNTLSEGTFDENTGKITIAGTTTNESVSTKGTLASLGISNDNIGDYIDLGNNLVGTTSTSDDWRILYVEGENVYAILAYYLPNEQIPTGDNIEKQGHNVWSTTDRTALLDNYLLDESIWSSFANGISGATVTGGPTADLLMNSYNTKKGTNLNYYDSTTKLDTTESLYLPNDNVEEGPMNGYWLTSNDSSSIYVWIVDNFGNMDTYGFSDTYFGVRPVVCLPANISAEKNSTTKIWTIK